MGIKPKHQGLAVTLIMALSLMIAIGYTGYSLQGGTNRIKPVPPIVPVKINVPDPQEIHLMRKLSSKLEAIAFPSDSLLKQASLEIFGDEPALDEKSRTKAEDGGYSDNLEYQLSFTFSSGRRHFCIIDDVFYAQGETLPDGSKIIQVAPHKVLLQRDAKRVWIPLAISTEMTDAQTLPLKKSSLNSVPVSRGKK